MKKAYVREHREGPSLPTQEEETERAREDFLEELSAFGLGLNDVLTHSLLDFPPLTSFVSRQQGVGFCPLDFWATGVVLLACDLSGRCVQALWEGLNPRRILRALTLTWNPIPTHCLLANQYPCRCLTQPAFFTC